MGLVLPARASTADEAAGQESRKRENFPICHTRIVRENPRVCTRTRTRHHRRYSYADGQESEHAQAALPPASGKGTLGDARQRSRRLVWVGIEPRTLGHDFGPQIQMKNLSGVMRKLSPARRGKNPRAGTEELSVGVLTRLHPAAGSFGHHSTTP